MNKSIDLPEKIRIFILDLMPVSELGDRLSDILEHCNRPAVHVRRDFISPDISDFCETFTALSDFSPHVVFLVLLLGCARTVKLLRRFLVEKSHKIPVLAVIDGSQPNQVLEVLKLGVEDFITPPLRSIDILPRIRRLLAGKQETQVKHILQRTGEKLRGKSAAFLEEIKKIPPVAGCDACVLISGETGTGKELFARAIHDAGPRAKKSFVAASCGALPLELVENELFGHVRGAFTGAHLTQSGLICEAEGGTLFLDEIDCLPLLAQAKLLRFIQEREYRPLGHAKPHRADVRIIASTNIDLEKAVEKGDFRQDLYYRLNVVPFSIPPLRDRKMDIPILAEHFLARFSSRHNRETEAFSAEALAKMMTYHWPGNVRELENAVERAVIFSQSKTVHEGDIALQQPVAKTSYSGSYSEAKKQFTIDFIEKTLAVHGGNISAAARAANKDRRAFWELMRQYGIQAQRPDPDARR